MKRSVTILILFIFLMPHLSCSIVVSHALVSANWAIVSLPVGASITLTPDEGPTGAIVTIEGRGWTPASEITFTLDGSFAEVVDGDTITVETKQTKKLADAVRKSGIKDLSLIHI